MKENSSIGSASSSTHRSTSDRKKALMIGSLISVLLIASLLALVVIPSMQKSRGLTAQVYQDGTLLYTIDLSAVTESYELTATTADGHYNLIVVRPGSIGITDADCPDKLCVNMGFRDSAIMPITCLPNKVVIQIEVADGDSGASESGTGGSEMPLDGVAY